jgi:hypothetical protein
VGKKVQELTADLGVAGIVEGKLGGGGSTRYRVSTARFRGAATVFWRLECRKAKEIDHGASARRCGADGALG